jgi:hypothetical protein
MAATPDMSTESLQRYIEGHRIWRPSPAGESLPRLADDIEDWIWCALKCEAAAALLSHLRMANCERRFSCTSSQFRLQWLV